MKRFLVNWLVIVVAVVRMVRVDRARLGHGRWSKAGWILAAGLIVWNVGPIAVPLGVLTGGSLGGNTLS